MLQITQKDFCNLLCKDKVAYLGVARVCLTDDELRKCIDKYFVTSSRTPDIRKYTKHSNYVVSDNDSRLYIKSDEYKTMTFYIYNYDDGRAIMSCAEYKEDSKKHCCYYALLEKV